MNIIQTIGLMAFMIGCVGMVVFEKAPNPEDAFWTMLICLALGVTMLLLGVTKETAKKEISANEITKKMLDRVDNEKERKS